MAISDYLLIDAWREVLALSRVGRGRAVTIVTGPATNAQTLRCALIAAQSMGAITNRLDFAPVNGEKSFSRDSLSYVGASPLTGNPVAIAALKASDLVLDLMMLAFSPEQGDILKDGTKMLLAVEPPEVLMRMVPTPGDKVRVLAAVAKLGAAREMRVTSPAGSSLICPLGEFPPAGNYGFADEPGRRDHWPGGFAWSYPNLNSAHGTIVVDRGDILLPQKRYVTEPIVLTVENGAVTEIEGGVDAALLRDFRETFRDPQGHAISHVVSRVGWGLQPRARWSTLGLYNREATIGMDARAFEGNFLLSLGSRREGGASAATTCHIDIPLRHCTVWLDDDVMVRDGMIVSR